MPGKIKVKILAGRNLPVMDRSGDTTDAYVELKFGNTTFKTDVCRKSLNPQWNSEWYRFEVDDAELQDEPLQIRLMDHDTYSANDAIGKVYVNLNPLLLPGTPPTVKNIWTLEAAMNTNTGSQSGSVMTGWIPVYDTMHGIRGEVNIIVKVELFSDFNKFRQSSCGVQFFYSPNIPYGYHTQSIHGFVEELIVSDDPEYKWIDKIRTPRASNEARQTLFFKLSGEVQRKIGLKALDLGGNAVIGYLQNFDLEGESGIVARGIGTAVTLVKTQDIFNFPSDNSNVDEFYTVTLGAPVAFVSGVLMPSTAVAKRVAYAFLSKSKVQKERVQGIEQSMPPLFLTSNRSTFPLMPDARVTRINENSPNYKNTAKCRKHFGRKLEYEYEQPEIERSTTIALQSDMSNRSLNKLPFHASSEPVVNDESVRMMLALEDERNETARNKLEMSIKNVKKIFAVGDADSKHGSSPRLSAMASKSGSARSSIASVYNPKDATLNSSRILREGIASILIKSIHNVPLENVRENNDSSLDPHVNESNERLIDQDDIENTKKANEEEQKEDENENEKLQEMKTYRDWSSEENTSSSDELASNGSKGYDILRDSVFSSDEEFDASYLFIDRAFTFPLRKRRPTNYKLRRVDSDTRPLREESMLFLRKCLSANDITFNTLIPSLLQGDTVSEMSIIHAKEDHGVEKSPAQNIAEEPSKTGMRKETTSEFPSKTEAVEHDLTPFLENQECINHSESFSLKVAAKATPDTVDSKQRSFDQLEKTESVLSQPERVDCQNDEACATEVRRNDNTATSITNDQKSETNFSETSKSKCGDYIEGNNTKKNTPESKTDVDSETSSTRVSRTDVAYRKEHNINSERSLMFSTCSLPSLEYLPLAEIECTNMKKRNANNEIFKSISTIPSSVESLIRSSADTLETMQDRRKCMLDLIKLIDTKMLAHHAHHNNNDKHKRKKREKIHKHINSTDSHRGPSCRLSKKHFHRYISSEVILASSFPSNLSLHESQPLPIKTDPFSYKLELDGQRTDSIENSNNIEMKVLKNSEKSSETNTLTVLSPTSVDSSVIRKSHSTYNIREVMGQDEITNKTNTANITDNSCVSRPFLNHRQQDEVSLSPSYPLPAVPPMVSKISQSPASKAQAPVLLHRRSSDSDLSVTPKGNSLGGSDRSMGGVLKSTAAVLRTMNQDALEMLEYPFITMQQYPPGFIIHIGGLVSSRSVKLLERISNLEEPEGRDAWWTEIRMEVRSHARALACNVVIGYKEETSICDDVCVLNASGTAAVINLHNPNPDSDTALLNRLQQTSLTTSTEPDRDKSQSKSVGIKIERNDNDESSISSAAPQTGKVRHASEGKDPETFNSSYQSKCSLCHLPYSETSVPFRVSVSKCAICKRAKVPDIMFTTIELPENMPTSGRGCFIQATVCKNKKDLRGELNAKEISDCLPFLEYELHSLLLNKLKVKGMNAVFGLKLQVSVGERLIIGMAVGTAVFLTALPTPCIPQIASGNSWNNEEQLSDIKKTLMETVKKNRDFYRLKPVGDIENGRIATASDTDDSDEDLPDIDFNVGTRDTCVLEVDDIEDMDRITLLMDDRPPDDFHVVNTQSIPGLEDLEIVRNLQMFTQISRAKIPAGQSGLMPSKYFAKLLQSVYFKLRRMVPCALCDLQFKLALSEPDEIQFTVVGMALGLGDPVKVNKFKKKLVSHSVSKDQVKKSDDSDMIFSLDVDHNEVSSDNTTSTAITNSSTLTTSISGPKSRQRSPLRLKTHVTHKHKHVPLKGRYGVDITPLSYLPGGRIERYLGNLNFFFIRESTSIRENGGLSGFTHSFIMEVLAIVRAHITALGGNAMVAFFMTQCVLLHSPHKNQGQCLINVGGDVVSVSYYADEKLGGPSNC